MSDQTRMLSVSVPADQHDDLHLAAALSDTQLRRFVQKGLQVFLDLQPYVKQIEAAAEAHGLSIGGLLGSLFEQSSLAASPETASSADDAETDEAAGE